MYKPIYLSQELMDSVKAAVKESDRTTTEQIEHWVSLGITVNKTITRDDMLNVLCGLVELKVEKVPE